MKTVTVNEELVVYVNPTKQVVSVDKYETTDGRRFPLDKRAEAEKHQQAIDAMDKFKAQIKYTDVDPMICNYDNGEELERSFTFEWNDTVEDAGLLTKLVNSSILRDGMNLSKLPAGKYLVMQYSRNNDNPNGRDWMSYSGYFGLVSEYVSFLESELTKAKQLL